MQITDMDIEWAEAVAGQNLSIEEVADFKNDYEDWISDMERDMENFEESF
jgi:hypothetical protein